MPAVINNNDHFIGLEQHEIPALREKYGRNSPGKEKSVVIKVIIETVTEPMFILLSVACSVYFFLGQVNEGLIMAAAIILVSAISIYQGARSSKALKALQDLTAPRVMVIRSGNEVVIFSADLLPGDIMVLFEGERIPADAVILRSNDLSVNESVLTGESFAVDKNENSKNNNLYQGTLINSGKCFAKVTAIGEKTELGKIGKSIEAYAAPKTELQQDISSFVRKLALFGIIAFLFIWGINYFKTSDVWGSLLIGLTLAMAAIPEEIPVAFSSFMALGAYRMSKLGIISRQPQVIENLGAISVICLDKTGTITENKMEVKSIYDFKQDRQVDLPGVVNDSDVLYYAMLASEINPFDEMEKGIIQSYLTTSGDPAFVHPSMIHEYPLGGSPPMMTHVYQIGEDIIVAAKGAPERIARACQLSDKITFRIQSIVKEFAKKGQRVIAVAGLVHKGAFPVHQDDFAFEFKGLVSLYDPPKQNIENVFKQLEGAGISVKLITGDYAETAINIAEQVGIHTNNIFLTGEQVMNMDDVQLNTAVKRYVIFARMFPEAKLKVVNAIKSNGEIVAMTGDGVNDGPALKSSNVGIAMGKKGTQIARQAADIILTDDDLQKVVESIRQGRKIYFNLKKAVRYIISIHIPIILTASLPLLFGWKFPNIFTPVHVIFLELIMGPTCSIFFENEPAEENSMNRQPRKRSAGLFVRSELWMSIFQGLIITAGVLGLYFIFMRTGHSLSETRTIVFTTLLIANIFLTLVNRSFTENILTTMRYRNNLVVPFFIISILFLMAVHYIPFIRSLFGLSVISLQEFFICLGTGFISVFWFELYKTVLKKKRMRNYDLTVSLSGK